jgi:hypothetical protein
VPGISPAVALLALASLFGAASLRAGDKLSFDERIEIERGLTAEMAIAKILLPRSAKPLLYTSDGHLDKAAWDKALHESGPAARTGDQIQITRVLIESDRILLEINGGTKKAGHWYDSVQVGVNGSAAPVHQNSSNSNAASGSNLAVVFKGGVPSIKSSEIKEILAPVFDFDKHSASENYVDKLPEPIQRAIREQRPLEGMDREQLLLAMGKPRNKSRETTKDGDEIEDWVYGEPPGKITFVTLSEGKVVKIREAYASVGGSTAPPLPPN